MKPLNQAVLASIISIAITTPAWAGDLGTVITRSPHSRVNVRSGPGMTYGVAFQLRPGAQVNISDQQQVGRYTWYRVGWEFSGDGWIRGDLIQPIALESEPCITQATPPSQLSYPTITEPQPCESNEPGQIAPLF